MSFLYNSQDLKIYEKRATYLPPLHLEKYNMKNRIKRLRKAHETSSYWRCFGLCLCRYGADGD